MRISLLQLTTSSDLNANILAVKSLLEKAVAEGAELIATPENTFFMRGVDDAALKTLYTLEDHPGVIAAKEWAAHYKVWILIGSVAVADAETLQQTPANYNRSLLISPEGKIVRHYDKLHLFDVELAGGESYKESSRMLPGKEGAIYPLPGAKLGLTVCYDLRFPQLYRALAQAGADIIAVPSAFTQVTGEAHWHVLLRARAIENGCFIIAPAQCGTHEDGRKTYGHSLVVNPWGEIIAERAENTPGVLTVTIDLNEVKNTRSRIPSLQHDRAFGEIVIKD